MSSYSNLKGLIAQHNLTQEYVAKKLEISIQTLSNKMNKKTLFNIEEINKLIKLFNATYEFIFFENEKPKTANF